MVDNIINLQKKFKRLGKRIDNISKLSPRDCAKYMVLKAKMYAPYKTGKMRENIFAVKRGKGSWVVQSSREGEITSFPVHLWVNTDILSHGRKYGSGNVSGTPGYFDKAFKETRIKCPKSIRRKLEAALSAEFRG